MAAASFPWLTTRGRACVLTMPSFALVVVPQRPHDLPDLVDALVDVATVAVDQLVTAAQTAARICAD